MNKLDRFDAKRLLGVRGVISVIKDYNATDTEYDSLTKKLNTILKKIDHVLDTELEPELQEEYKLLGTI